MAFTDLGENFSEVLEDKFDSYNIVPSVLRNITLKKVGFVIGGGDTCQVACTMGPFYIQYF